MSSSTKYIPTAADLERLAARTPADYRYMSSGEGVPPYARVYDSKKGFGFEYDEPSYPTKRSAPARYSPGEGHPFGYEAYEKLKEADEKAEEDEEKDDEYKEKLLGPIKPSKPQSTDIFSQRTPSPNIASPRGYRDVAPPPQWEQDMRYSGSKDAGTAALAIIAGLLGGPNIGQDAPTGATNIKSYQGIFSYF